MKIRIRQTVLITVSCAVALVGFQAAAARVDDEDYFKRVESITDSFERIQAAMEVAFDSSVYVRSLQELRYQLKKFNEVYRRRKERKYLSFMLASSIEKTYLGLVKKVTSNSGKLTKDEINRVIDSNQWKIALLQEGLKKERKEGRKAAWIDIIRTSMESGAYPEAQSYAKLARTTFGDEREFRKLQGEIEKVLLKLDEDVANAKKLMEEKRYRDALVVLEGLVLSKRGDTEIAKMYETTALYVKKMDELIAEAQKYEKGEKLKEAYRTWEKLLEYEPQNKVALKKIEKYRKQLKLGTKEVVSTCLNCSGHGYCIVCKGSGLCSICNGYRKCIKCRGAGFFARRCPYWICKDCRGGGMCTTCEGRGTVTCTSCNGLGYQRSSKTVSCSVCRGTGRSRFRDAPCPTCGGTGSIVIAEQKLCPVCRGAQVLPCPTCGNSGRCKTCGGLGHMPTCTYCNGTGVLKTECTYCRRRGVCPKCAGTGVCGHCKGSGKCIECNGSGIVVKKIDEEKYLSEKNHFISVTTDPPGARVYLDGKPRGTTPLEIENVTAGEHVIKLSKAGYDDFKYRTVFTESYSAEFDIRMTSRQSRAYRVVAISKSKHRVLFRHYQGQGDDSFMISLYLDGVNEWKELGDTIFGYEIAKLKKEFKYRYNPRLKDKQIIDMSSLVLKKSDGTEVSLLKNNTMQIVVYRAKIYDAAARRFIYVREGSKVGESVVTNITDNEVILQDRNGTAFTLSKQ